MNKEKVKIGLMKIFERNRHCSFEEYMIENEIEIKFLNYDNFNFENTAKYVRMIYKKAISKCPVIMYAENTMEGYIMNECIKNNYYLKIIINMYSDYVANYKPSIPRDEAVNSLVRGNVNDIMEEFMNPNLKYVSDRFKDFKKISNNIKLKTWIPSKYKTLEEATEDFSTKYLEKKINTKSKDFKIDTNYWDIESLSRRILLTIEKEIFNTQLPIGSYQDSFLSKGDELDRKILFAIDLDVIKFMNYYNNNKESLTKKPKIFIFNIFKYIKLCFQHYNILRYQSLCEISGALRETLQLFISAGFSDGFFESSYAIVSKYPKNVTNDCIYYNGINKLTTFKIFTVNNNVEISEHLIKARNKELAVEDFLSISNEEDKSFLIREMLNLYGRDYMTQYFSDILEPVDTYIDKKDPKFLKDTTGMNVGVYTLYKGNLSKNTKTSVNDAVFPFDVNIDIELAFVRCYCPSTDRIFLLGVDPKHTNAKDAIASLYRIPNNLKKHILYIQRQGERFSTALTEEGIKLAEENKNRSHLYYDTFSGDEYFSLMKFEY